ncbi:Uncharacterized protein (Fragment), partial [Durusdinium trenchii]
MVWMAQSLDEPVGRGLADTLDLAAARAEGLPGPEYSGYHEVARALLPLPEHCLDLCRRLAGSPTEVRARAQRAWDAGQWAKATLENKVAKPRPTPKLALQATCYIILRGPGIERPVRVASSAEYFKMPADVKYLDQGVFMLQVLGLDFAIFGLEGVRECFAVPIMSRAAGTLFAVPVGFFPEEVLSGGSEAASGDFVGPSTVVTVSLVFEEEDGTESQTGLEAEVLLVDLHKMVMDFVGGEVYSWLESATEGRAQYYSAEEPPPQTVIPKQSRQKNRAPVGGASPPKRVTTATLAEQLAELSKSIHATSSQLETMAQRQDRMENLLASPAAPAQLPVPAHQRPFQTAAPGNPSPLQFMRGVGTPPRVRTFQEKATRTPLAPEVPEIPEDEPLALPSDPDFVAATAPTGNNQPMDVTSAIFQQSQALSTLVAHLVNQDGLDSYDMHHDAYHYIPCSGSEDFCRDDGTFADDAGPFEEEPASERCGSRQRRRLMVDRAFHVCIMALNFWHADFKHIPVESIAKEPSPAQAQALVNLKRMLRAFGSSQEEFSVPKSGRRLTSLIALLSDPSEFATWRGIGGSAYSRSFPGAPDIGKKETYVPRNLSRAEELRPYRALDPDRLVLSGKAFWNPDRSQAAQLLQKATTAYEEAGLLGSPAKDILDEQKACIMGAEIDGSQAARENGVVTVGAPVHRRLALAYVSLTLAKMRYTTDALHVCLVGGWVNAVLYRRPAMSLLQEVYKIPLSEVSQDSPKVIRLSRGMAQELIMLAVLCPFLATDISTHVQEQCYATDSSDAKGAVVSCKVPRNIARALVRTGRKKTTYTKMLAKHEAVLKKIDIDFEEADIPNDEFADDSFTAPDRPRVGPDPDWGHPSLVWLLRKLALWTCCRACASILSVLLDFSLGLDFMDFQHLASKDFELDHLGAKSLGGAAAAAAVC